MTNAVLKAPRQQSEPASKPKVVRVAIYTRKSVSEGLEQEFNTLDAQREAVEAYIRSQREEGWEALPARYDDGGYTGANTNRPAFRRLLEDVQAGLVDVVAVYKFDRLSRSQIDFLQTIELLEKHDVAFVSVTQKLDTSSSMGRCMMNIMVAFAQLEREVISERTRDKMQAARRRGLWTGGRPVLGYDVVDKTLVVNAEEAERVREIFAMYLDLGSLLAVRKEVHRRGWLAKKWTTKKGKTVGGGAFTKQTIHGLLTNPLYTGKTRAGDTLVEGTHEAIIDESQWESPPERWSGRRRQGATAAHRGQHGAPTGPGDVRSLWRSHDAPLHSEGNATLLLLRVQPSAKARSGSLLGESRRCRRAGAVCVRTDPRASGAIQRCSKPFSRHPRRRRWRASLKSRLRSPRFDGGKQAWRRNVAG